MTPKLTDLQRSLLSSAAGRDTGNLMPPPRRVAHQLAQIRKAVSLMLKRRLVAEVDVVDDANSWRQDGDRHLGVFITDAGRAEIGAEVLKCPPLPAQPANPAPTSPLTKSAQLRALLRREEGATLGELVEATEWLPHMTRAALTVLYGKRRALSHQLSDRLN